MNNIPVANKTELLSLLRQHSAQLRGYGVRKLMLFGSFVRDKDIHEHSDVDFFCEMQDEKINLHNVCGLSDFLEDLLGRKVEVIEPYCISKFILPQVLQEVEDVELEEMAAL